MVSVNWFCYDLISLLRGSWLLNGRLYVIGRLLWLRHRGVSNIVVIWRTRIAIHEVICSVVDLLGWLVHFNWLLINLNNLKDLKKF